jgi:hypothetical protein
MVATMDNIAFCPALPWIAYSMFDPASRSMDAIMIAL